METRYPLTCAWTSLAPRRPRFLFRPIGVFRGVAAALLLVVGLSHGQSAEPNTTNALSDILYTNDRKPEIPWSIHIVRVPRHSGNFEIHSMHAGGRAMGLATVSRQLLQLNPALGRAVAGINGDFYERQGSYAGDTRGLQIMEGELISAAAGNASFWLDAIGEPHTSNTTSFLQVTWPNGKHADIGLNEDRQPNDIVLYTPAMGSSTHTAGGREIVLEGLKDQPWLPLRVGKTYRASVREIRTSGDSPIAPETLVLSVGPAAVRTVPAISAGAHLEITTGTQPDLRGVKTAISGGPVLVRGGKAQRIRPAGDSYVSSSALERHPRSAVGWNNDFFFLVEVDGRQPNLSMGMTLNELGAYLAKLGCTDAMNLDGGGSSAIWTAGRIKNRPCDGHERPVANSLVVVSKPPSVAKDSAAGAAAASASSSP